MLDLKRYANIIGTGYKPTPEQVAAIDFVVNGKGNAVGKGVAGCGKSKTMEIGLKCFMQDNRTKKTAYIVFNVKNKNEFNSRMAAYKSQCDVMTMNGYGYKAILKYCSIDWKHCKMDYNRWSNYIRENIHSLTTYFDDQWDWATSSTYIGNIKDLFSFARINLVVSGQTEQLESLCKNHHIDCIGDEVEVVNRLLTIGYKVPKLVNGILTIDFTDQICIPAANDEVAKYLPTYDLVVGDECQDFNRATQTLLLKASGKVGRWIAIGDPMQAINGFAGAMCDSYAKLYEMAENHFELTYNFRCGRKICELANEIVPELKAWSGAKEGIVRRTDTLKDIKAGDLILCRKTAPLVSLCLKYIANGHLANVQGNDIVPSIQRLIAKVCKGKCGRGRKKVVPTIYQLYNYLDAELESMIAAAKEKGYKENSQYIAETKDKIEIIHTLGDQCNSVDAIVDKLKEITKAVNEDDKEIYINLCSVHRSKGDECNRVFIIAPDKLPLIWRDQLEWEYEQEMHLKYVAITRAKEELVFVDLNEEQLANYQF